MRRKAGVRCRTRRARGLSGRALPVAQEKLCFSDKNNGMARRHDPPPRRPASQICESRLRIFHAPHRRGVAGLALPAPERPHPDPAKPCKKADMTCIAFLSPYRGPLEHEKLFRGEAKDCFSGCLRYPCLCLVPRLRRGARKRTTGTHFARRYHYILELFKFFVELTRIVPWANQGRSQGAFEGKCGIALGGSRQNVSASGGKAAALPRVKPTSECRSARGASVVCGCARRFPGSEFLKHFPWGK